MDDAVGQRQNYEPRNGNTHAYGRQRPFQAHIQKRGDERPRPRSRTGQRYGDEDEKSLKAVGLNALCLFMSLALDKGRKLVEDVVLFHTLYHLTREQNQKRHGQHITYKTYGEGRPRIHSGGNSDGDSAAYLKYRQHGRDQGFEYVWKHWLSDRWLRNSASPRGNSG